VKPLVVVMGGSLHRAPAGPSDPVDRHDGRSTAAVAATRFDGRHAPANPGPEREYDGNRREVSDRLQRKRTCWISGKLLKAWVPGNVPWKARALSAETQVRRRAHVYSTPITALAPASDPPRQPGCCRLSCRIFCNDEVAEVGRLMRGVLRPENEQFASTLSGPCTLPALKCSEVPTS
jgi:hypothetical protein